MINISAAKTLLLANIGCAAFIGTTVGTTPSSLANDTVEALDKEAEASTEVTANTYLADADEFERPLTAEKRYFGCEDKIYAVAELANYPKGKYEFAVRWIDPSGTTREHTRYPFHIHNTETRLWSWLSLRRGAGAGVIKWLDPSAGLEDFIGLWKVEVSVNGKKLSSLEMEVNC